MPKSKKETKRCETEKIRETQALSQGKELQDATSPAFLASCHRENTYFPLQC